MKIKKRYSKVLGLTLLTLVIALIAAQCGAAPVVEEPAPAPAEEETQAEEQAPVAEEEVAEEPAAEAEVAAEEEAAAAEEEPAAEAEAEEAAPTEEEVASEEETTDVIEESQAAKATELQGGITVTTDEEVSSPRSNFGGEYRDLATSEAVSFHPYLTTDSTSSGYQAMVYTGGLLRLDENTLEYIPNMAESYSISEDGLTFTFNLRKDMKWSDGEPITAQDFKWTYDQVTKPENEYPYLSQLEFITSYEALDDYTLEVKIEELYAPALGQMSGLITPLPQHVWEGLDWSDPETNPEINNPSVVSGPYKLEEWKRDQFVIFEANENYWYHGAPNITRQTLEIVPNADIAYEKMKSGETDTGIITPDNLEEAKQLENINVYEWWPAASGWTYVGLNMREGFPTHDVRIRHAINYAIDKQLITDEVQLGNARRMCSIYPDTSWVYNPDVPCYEYDPDKAIELFAEAGYTLEGDQMLDENGEQLTLSLLYVTPSDTSELIALAVQDYLKDVGVAVDLQALEWNSFLEETDSDSPSWDMFLGAWRATIEPHIMFTIWAEENIPDLNSVAYINKEVEALFEEAGATYDTEFRKEKYQEIQRIIAEDAPYVFLYYRKSWSGQNVRVKGIEPTALGIGWNTEDWFIEEAPE
ncbi:MAG: ABC transporter substrate-binding protein [Anaerolineae bacterium]|nr:ABC transporter substrate-binding protein [Anaerolineae bacterium]